MRGGILALLLALAGLQQGADGPARVRVVRPVRPQAARTILLPATLEPYERAPIHARVTGYVKRVLVDIGSRVRRGDLLLELDVPELAAALKVAAARVAAARAEATEAEARARVAALRRKRFEALQQQDPGAVPELQLEETRAAEAVARAQAEAARARIQVAAAERERLTALLGLSQLRAPFDGVVWRRRADPGALAPAGRPSSPPLLEILRTDRLRLVTHVPERYVTAVAALQEIRFRVDAFPGRRFSAPVARRAGALDPETRSLRVEADVTVGKTGLLPGLYAAVELLLHRDVPGALELPARALHTRAGVHWVEVVRAGKLARLEVELLLDEGNRVFVRGPGLSPGTPVVIERPPDLAPGAAVEIAGDGKEARS